MIDLLGLAIGAAVASVPWFLFLLWIADHAWWLGVKDHVRRKYPECEGSCWICNAWRKCMERIETIVDGKTPVKDLTKEPWFKRWKRGATQSD